MNGLTAKVRVARDDFTLDVDIAAQPGEVVAVIGPNGAGKSTLLRTICGLTSISQGQIALGDLVVDEPDRGIWLAPDRRHTGVVFQDYLLFPHLSVRDNISFGPRSAGQSRSQSQQAANHWIERLALTELADRKPSTLSGGQAQRVALARALATDPLVLLLDEPMGALDVATRLDVRAELRTHLRDIEIPTLLVTHDPLDALVLADRIIVLENGRVTQQGKALDVARRPATTYVARLLGLNLLRGKANDGTITLDAGGVLNAAAKSDSGDVLVAVRPDAISLHANQPEGSARNVWQGVVDAIEPIGDRVRVTVTGAPTVMADVTTSAIVELGLAKGSQVWLSTKATELEVYPAA